MGTAVLLGFQALKLLLRPDSCWFVRHDLMEKSELNLVKLFLLKRVEGFVLTMASLLMASKLNKNWEVAIVGDNLSRNRHWEFQPTDVQTKAAKIPRMIFDGVSHKF
jgi:hypothetical protein